MTERDAPGDDIFCMECGPGTVLAGEPGAASLQCPRCGGQRRLAGLPLFVVTGAGGAGKTTITGPLRRLLPGCEVLEADVTLHVAAPSFPPGPERRREAAGGPRGLSTGGPGKTCPSGQPAACV